MVYLSGVQFSARLRWLSYQTEDGWAEQFSLLPQGKAPGKLIDEWAISGSAGGEITAVFSRELPDWWGPSEVSDYFDGNLAASDAEIARIDVGSVEPMPEVEFWNIIKSFESSSAGSSDTRMSSVLACLTQRELIAWRLRLEALIYSLSAAGIRASARVEGKDVTSDDASAALSSAVILAGVEAYERARRDPEWAREEFASAGMEAERLLVAADTALSRQMGVAAVRADWAPADGVNSPSVDPPARTWRRVLDERQRTLDVVAKTVLEVPPRSSIWLRAEEQREWRTARVVARASGRLFERMLLMPFRAIPGALDAPAPTPAQLGREVDLAAQKLIRAQAGRESQSLHKLELRSSNPAPWNGGIFEIVRRSTLTEDDYAMKYRIGSGFRTSGAVAE